MTTTEKQEITKPNGFVALLKKILPNNKKKVIESREEMSDLLQAALKNNVIEKDTLDLIEGALTVAAKQVREIMVPLSQMNVIKLSDSIDKILDQIIATGHSRYPLIGDGHDDIRGIFLAKDSLPLLQSNKNIALDEIKREAIFVPESKRLNVLLKEFRENRNHMAIVKDEYGGVAGLVTIEDVLEEIVGEIEDEYDDEVKNTWFEKKSENSFIVDPMTPVQDFNDYFKTSLETETYDTVGGVVTHNFGHIPKRGEITNLGNLRFKVLDTNKRRIIGLRLTIIDKPDN